MLEERATPWARLGLAKALFIKQHYPQAEALLAGLVAENENYLDAYDWLARTREAAGQLETARDVLLRANTVSPNRLARLRRLGTIALDLGDPGGAENVLSEVVRKGKYSDFRDPADHVWLMHAQIGSGKLEDAAATLRDLDKSMGATDTGRLCTAMSSAMLHQRLGDSDKARAAAKAALQASTKLPGMSTGLKHELARTCFDNGMDDEGSTVVLDILRTEENPRNIQKTRQMLEAGGRSDLATQLEKRIHEEVRLLVSVGAEKAKAGDYDGAVEEMLNAARKMPNNSHVMFNAALALLQWQVEMGADEPMQDAPLDRFALPDSTDAPSARQPAPLPPRKSPPDPPGARSATGCRAGSRSRS